MTWNILGISDEVETCERCGKTGLKRTVVLTDGEGETFVGTECASRMTGIRGSAVNRKAKEVQYEADKEKERAEWSLILNVTHYRFLKNQVYNDDPSREEKARFGFSKVVEQSGLAGEVILSHLESRWGTERVSFLKGR